MKKIGSVAIAFALLSLLVFSSALSVSSNGFTSPVLKTKKVHNGDGWQYIGVGKDPTGIVTAQIPKMGTFEYVANYGSSTISVINPVSNKVVKTITTSTYSDCYYDCKLLYLTYDPSNSMIYIQALLSGEPTLLVLNATSNTFVASITLSYESSVTLLSQGIAYNPANQEIYVSVGGYCPNDYQAVVDEIDTNTNTLVHSTTVGGCGDTGGPVAYDPLNQEVYVGSNGLNPAQGNISVISSSTNGVVAVMVLGNGTGGLAYDPVSEEMYATIYTLTGSSISGSACQIDSTNSVLGCLDLTAYGGNALSGIVYDPADHDMYVGNASDFASNGSPGPVFILDGVRGDFLGSVTAFGLVTSMAYSSANGGEIYAPNGFSSTVTELGGSSYTLGNTWYFGFSGGFVTFDPIHSMVYEASYFGSQVVAAQIPFGSDQYYSGFNEASGIAYDPNIGVIMVANYGNGTVSLVNVTAGATQVYLGSLSSGSGPNDVYYIPGGNVFLVPNFASDNVSVYEYYSGTWYSYSLNNEFGIGSFDNPLGIASYFNATNGIASYYISNEGNNTVTAISAYYPFRVTDIAVGDAPQLLTVANNHVYVPDSGSGQVSIINVVTNTVTKTVSGIPNAWQAVYDPQDRDIFVSANYYGGYVYAVDPAGAIVSQMGVTPGGLTYPGFMVYSSTDLRMYVVASNFLYGINS